MIPFGRLLSFPLTFKNLEGKIKELTVQSIDATESGGVITVDSTINDHQQQMLIHGDLIESNLPVQVYCSCQFFTYNLAYALNKVGSLLYPENFILKPPKSKNTSLTISGCKHLILLARSLYQNRELIKKA